MMLTNSLPSGHPAIFRSHKGYQSVNIIKTKTTIFYGKITFRKALYSQDKVMVSGNLEDILLILGKNNGNLRLY